MSTLAWALLVTLEAAEGRAPNPPLLSPERLRAEALCIAEAIIGAGVGESSGAGARGQHDDARFRNPAGPLL